MSDLAPAAALAELEQLARAFLGGQGAAPVAAARPARPSGRAGVILLDQDEHVQAFDEEAEQLWGVPASKVLLAPASILFDGPLPDSAAPVRRELRRDDGSRLPVLVSRHRLGATRGAAPMPGATSALLIRGDHPDSASADVRYRSLVEQIPAVVFTAALDGGLHDLYVGPQIEVLLGYTQAEWLSNPVLWYQRLHPDDRAILDREFARGCAEGGSFRAECRFLARDGRVVWVHGEARLIRDDAGWPRLVQGVAFDISETKRAEELVRSALREKEMLLREIHHRVKNNLQITSSLLRLQTARTADGPARQVLQESQSRIRSMALVHEMLYRSSDLSRVDFGDYVRTLVAQLFRSHGVDQSKVRFLVDIPDASFGIDLAVPCGLVINELVANALKHAFPPGHTGTIAVSLSRSGNVYRLTVRDDGIGLPRDLDPGRGMTLGLQLVRTQVEQLNGTIQRGGAAGTEFIITFPAPPDPR